MIELLGGIGWGLLACGAITHVWHHERLRSLLAMHFDHERLPAIALTTVEAGLAVILPISLLTAHWSLPCIALAALVLGVGFMAWIARLLLTGSNLPCACSFSDAPTTIWSLARSVCVGLVGLYWFVDVAVVTDLGSEAWATRVATLAVGWAIGAAIFVLPEAVVWPSASRALLARVDAHTLQS